ncbi:nitrite/sulfite reductase [Kordiimonas laminariae]|uniref:nitrite/sulfite reductase n=1 Tax=Kordiimonas laminariae TaxID=2917717 RepID=UPI001FF1E083|nr:nitrite/sulfite reductase [Kordiimonas laminariae]MCK0069066.1 nitrite/sulfite reductase [Kordiimonas laminariae]
MYAYDQFDHAMVASRNAEFRDQVERRLKGELTEDEFKPLRLMNGLYLQLHAYMLRAAIPYGTLSADQMRRLAHIARRYDKGYGHFTTRQNVQFNWPKLSDTPDILDELAEVEMHAIQTSGNCIRNVTTDQFAGATADEVADPRPYAELLRQWSTFHPEFSFLPRKFKIAITGASADRAAVKWHDIGLVLKQNDAGEVGFEVSVGGGMGRTPVIGKVIRDFLPEKDLLSYMEAILRVYNENGRRDNKYKARIKILVEAMGADEYARQTEAEWDRIKDAPIDVPEEEAARIKAFFAPPPLEVLEETNASVDEFASKNFLFASWLNNNTNKHKVPGYVNVTISLKPHGGIAGDATAEQMELVAALADAYSQSEIRVSHEQNLILPHVPVKDLATIWADLDEAGLGTANVGLITDMIVCPGLDYCALANARSIPIGQAISNRFDDMKRIQDIGPLKIKMSGCINACGHHHAGHIGILGVDRKGEESYQILLGGSGAEDASKGTILGPGFDEHGIVDAVEKVVAVYLGEREEGEEFLGTYRRIGAQPFKEALYGTH